MESDDQKVEGSEPGFTFKNIYLGDYLVVYRVYIIEIIEFTFENIYLGDYLVVI